MIWLREGNLIVGYAPVLKKEYSDEEILQMSKYSHYEGWSSLSRFVMELQGIEYEDDKDYGYAKYSVEKLVDISTSFSYECSWEGMENKDCMKEYIQQIYDVFKNLKLYRLEQHSICDMRKLVDIAKEDMKPFVSPATIQRLNMDVLRSISDADHITKNLKKLLDLFSKQGYTTINLFDIPSEDTKKLLSTERKIDKKLVCQ